MKLKKQKIGYWVGTMLFDIGVILLAQSGWESRGYWLHPLLELGLIFLLPGIVIGFFYTAVPVLRKISRHFLLCRQKRILPLLRGRI